MKMSKNIIVGVSSLFFMLASASIFVVETTLKIENDTADTVELSATTNENMAFNDGWNKTVKLTIPKNDATTIKIDTHNHGGGNIVLSPTGNDKKSVTVNVNYNNDQNVNEFSATAQEHGGMEVDTKAHTWKPSSQHVIKIKK